MMEMLHVSPTLTLDSSLVHVTPEAAEVQVVSWSILYLLPQLKATAQQKVEKSYQLNFDNQQVGVISG